MDAERLVPADLIAASRCESELVADRTYSYCLTLDVWDETKQPAAWSSFTHRWTANGTLESVRALEGGQRAYHEDLFRWEIIRKLEASKTWIRRDRERLVREAFDFE